MRKTKEISEADVILVRRCIHARVRNKRKASGSGKSRAGVNNIPVDEYAQNRYCGFLIHRVLMRTVFKEIGYCRNAFGGPWD
jgi:hypothetical protein